MVAARRASLSSDNSYYIKGCNSAQSVLSNQWLAYVLFVGTNLFFQTFDIFRTCNYMDVLKGELNSTSTYTPAQLTKNKFFFIISIP